MENHHSDCINEKQRYKDQYICVEYVIEVKAFDSSSSHFDSRITGRRQKRASECTYTVQTGVFTILKEVAFIIN